jgi:NADH-quinone oxidoreductase subunit E
MKERTMAPEDAKGPKEYPGICSTCVLAPTCSYLVRNPSKVVWECEEFNNQEAPKIHDIVEKHSKARGGLISILGEIQAKYGYLPRHALKAVSEGTSIPLVEIYGIATFYRSFSLKPRGKHIVSVCLGTACHVRGGPAIAEEFERQLGILTGETTPDRKFTLETVNCLGACALGPIVVVDGRYRSNVKMSRVKKILRTAGEGLDKTDLAADPRIFPIEVSCPRCNHSLIDKDYHIDGYPSIRVTLSFGREHGWLRLSALYGSYTVESEHEMPAEAVFNFFCPHCHSELRGAADCPECSAPMVPMIVRGGGVVQICSRRGCKGHMLDLNGVNL